MAFHLPIEAPATGVVAAYWRITHVQMDCAARALDVQLHGHRDAEARKAGRAPAHRLAFRFDLGAMEEPGRISLAELYRAVRAAPAGTDPEGAPLPPLFRDAADI
ncbi:MAG: hypothetical protein MUC64_05185 [Rubritepida sp.]|nr:hypothetical protein [Rubritepida sp.]